MFSTVTIRFLLFALAIAGAVGVAACGGGDDDTENTSQPTAAGETPEAGTETPDADPIATGSVDAALPVDFPEDFPLYSNALLGQGARFANQVLVTFDTTDSLETVSTFYVDALGEPPWTLLTDAAEAPRGQVVLVFRHSEDPISGNLTIIEGTGDSTRTVLSLRFTVPETVGVPLATPDLADIPSATPTPTPLEG